MMRRRLFAAATAVSVALSPRSDVCAQAAAALAAPATPRTLSADTTFFPEGMDVDPRTGALYVTSMRHRNVFVSDGSGAMRALIDRRASLGSAFGIAIDTAHDIAWVAAAKTPFMMPAADDSVVHAELLRVTLREGRITGRWMLGDGSGMPGEIALAPDGMVLVSDGIKGTLHRLRPGAREMETVRSPLLRSPQGIAVDPSGGIAWFADWSRGIMRWDLRTDSITAVPGPEERAIRGVDGLRLWRGRLIGVQNGSNPQRVVEFTLDSDGRRIVGARVLDLPPAAGEPTVGVVIGDRYVFVSSGQWGLWSEQGVRNAAAGPLPAVMVRELRLQP